MKLNTPMGIAPPQTESPLGATLSVTENQIALLHSEIEGLYQRLDGILASSQPATGTNVTGRQETASGGPWVLARSMNINDGIAAAINQLAELKSRLVL